MAAVSAKLWDGARRATELAAERHELVERCARAEAAAKSAREACARLSSKLAGALGVDGTRPPRLSTPQLGSAAPKRGGRSGSGIQGSVEDAPRSREELVAAGRRVFDEFRRSSMMSTPGIDTPGT